MPKFPRNGMVIAPKTEHGMKARFRCKDGFELKGNPIVVCSFGNWSGEMPKCEEGRKKSKDSSHGYSKNTFITMKPNV